MTIVKTDIDQSGTIVRGQNGDSASKSGNTYIIGPNYGSLPANVSGPGSLFLRVWNSLTGVYSSFAAPRERLVATRTYYVRKDGSNSNNGLADNAAGAFLTIQAAVNAASQRIDACGNVVVVQVRTGNYNEDVILYPITGGTAGGGSCILRGDTTTPSNVIISGNSTCVFAQGNMPDWLVEGFKFVSNSLGVAAHQDAWIRLGKNDYGLCTTAHVSATESGTIEFYGAGYTISGGAAFHVFAADNGYVLNAGVLATLTGTPAFSSAFVSATTRAFVEWSSGTFSGAATGSRYFAASGGLISVGAAAYASFFPGNAAGNLNPGGRIVGLTMASAEYVVSLTGGQIAFPFTQNPSSDSNTLDDYEEGTWTPANANVALTVLSANYTKVGQLVRIACKVQWPATADANPAIITGLPFTALSPGSGCVGFNSSATNVMTLVDSALTTIQLFTVGGGGAATTNANMSGATIFIAATYPAT